MLEKKTRSLTEVLFAVVIFCAIPSVFSATKGLRVRSSPDIPVTEFSCTGRPPGYYADVEAGCQVYHMCTEGGTQFSYLCPNTTLFQQRMLICAHWYQVNCSKSDQYFGANLLIGQRDKPFVDEDPFNTRGSVKEVKTLQNPDALQNLGQPSREAKSFRRGKSQFGTDNASNNRVFQNNLKRDGGAEVAFTQNSQFTFSTTEAPFNNRQTPEDLSSLPIAGSVLPGGLRNFQFPQTTQRGFPFNNPSVSTTVSPFQTNNFRAQSTSPANFQRKSANPVTFLPPTSTPNFINRANSFGTTKSPVSFTPKFSQDNFNRLQPSGFQKPSTTSAFTQRISTPTPNFASAATQLPGQEEFVGGGLPDIDNIIKADIEQPLNGQLPNDRFNTFIKRFNPNEEPPRPSTQAPTTRFAPRVSTSKLSFASSRQDLTVASQENLVSSRRSTTSAPEEEDDEFVGGGLPHVDNIIKAEVEQPLNGSSPTDRFNTFIKRFNPLEEPPKPATAVANSEDSQQEVHPFINRFKPEDSPLVTGYNLEEQPGEPQFINRFVLTPDELMQDKNKHDIEKLHSLQPPDAQLTVNFPNFDLSPPLDDSDDSESNQIQLHLQDPRTAFFIPSDGGSDFSKADAAPILVTIPLHSNQQNIPMLFRKETSEEPCARCHPSFIVNKQNCVPCVIIR